MIERRRESRKRFVASAVVIAVAVFGGLGQERALAGYSGPGYGLQVVQSGEGLQNAAAYYQTVGTWAGSGIDELVPASFTMPTSQQILFSRLYLDVWGGTKDYTARATVTVNGTALPVINFGGTSDANPTYDAIATCVYGSGAGAWQLAYSGVAGLLKTDGTANSITVTISDPAGSGFDGRMYGVSLVAVYNDPTIDQVLDYYLAEADGTIRSTQPNSYSSPDQRSLTFADLNTADVISATYHAGYTHGSTTTGTNNLDAVFFNGISLGGNDVSTGNTTSYPPNNLTFDVSSYLLADSTVRYTVNGTELGGTGDTYLRPNIGLLEITHPVPEPATMSLLILGGLSVLARSRRRGTHPEARA